MEQVTLEKEKILNKAKARQAPSFHCGWRGFYLRQIRFFAHRLFAAIVRAGRRIEQSTWTARGASRSSSMPLARICNEDGDAGPLRIVPR
jgi:hypothetical protein